ncbi:unnamed protein product, partial [Staurois parvus]
MGPPGNRGLLEPLCPCPSSKKPMKKVPGASHGAPYLPRALGAVPEFLNVQSTPGS